MKHKLLGPIAGIALSVMAATNAYAAPAPEVTYDKVKEIFGLNLEEEGTIGQSLLLAVGMDHTSPDSPFTDQRIGIPFIVDAGPDYWVSRLTSGDKELEVLVNNALLLLFTKEEIPQKEALARKLLTAAADRGYWPADYFVAEYNLENYLAKDFQQPDFVRLPLAQSPDLQALAKDTMGRLNRCAEIGFAPCQFRIGFWLAGSEKTMNDAVRVLQQAIATAIQDTRYKGQLEGASINAAEIIVRYGKDAGISEERLAKTAEFIDSMKQDMLAEMNELIR